MTQRQFDTEASLIGLSVTIPNFDVQVYSLAFEYVAMTFKYVKNISVKAATTEITFRNDIESESFHHYIKTNLPIS